MLLWVYDFIYAVIWKKKLISDTFCFRLSKKNPNFYSKKNVYDILFKMKYLIVKNVSIKSVYKHSNSSCINCLLKKKTLNYLNASILQ